MQLQTRAKNGSSPSEELTQFKLQVKQTLKQIKTQVGDVQQLFGIDPSQMNLTALLEKSRQTVEKVRTVEQLENSL